MPKEPTKRGSSRKGLSTHNQQNKSTTSHRRDPHAPATAGDGAINGANVTFNGPVYLGPSPRDTRAPSSTGPRNNNRFSPYGRPQTSPKPASSQRDTGSAMVHQRRRTDTIASQTQGRPQLATQSNMPPPAKRRRDPCCNCGGDHKVAYCPKPNTEDGRLQVCLECNTIDHAWYTCDKFTRNETNEYFKLWVGRMGLCCIVHDRPANLLWTQFVYSDASRDTLDMAHNRPGPSTPAFVLQMLDSSKNYADIQKQLSEGRVLPWNLETKILNNLTERINKVVLDPVTCHMTEGTVLEGTGTKKIDEIRPNPMSPTTAWVMNNGNGYGADVPMPDASPLPPHASPVPIAPRRGSASVASVGLRARARAKFNKPNKNSPPFDPNLANIPCGNCGVCGHVFDDCNKPCHQCNKLVKGSSHPAKLVPDERCPYRCWCGEKVDHSFDECPVPCRSCVLAGKEPVPSVVDCEQHCPVHPEPDGVDLHEDCSGDLFGECQICNKTYMHWPQDCPEWLGRFCIRGDCMQKDCAEHCHKCGMGSLVAPTTFLKLQSEYGFTVANMPLLKELSDHWHKIVHRNWYHIVTTNGKKPWVMLQCQTHRNVVTKAEELDQIRENAWKIVASQLRDNPNTTVTDCFALQLPECPECFPGATNGTGDYLTRTWDMPSTVPENTSG